MERCVCLRFLYEVTRASPPTPGICEVSLTRCVTLLQKYNIAQEMTSAEEGSQAVKGHKSLDEHTLPTSPQWLSVGWTVSRFPLSYPKGGSRKQTQALSGLVCGYFFHQHSKNKYINLKSLHGCYFKIFSSTSDHICRPSGDITSEH